MSEKTQGKAAGERCWDGETRQPWDTAAADAHAQLRAQLQLAGTTIGVFDEMIAGHALALGAVVVTNNVRHFNRAKGLITQDWLQA